MATTAREKSLKNQCWAELQLQLPNIRRISLSGPDGSRFDDILVRAVFATLTGDLIDRQKEAADLEDS